jgi:hypothetical protein
MMVINIILKLIIKKIEINIIKKQKNIIILHFYHVMIELLI